MKLARNMFTVTCSLVLAASLCLHAALPEQKLSAVPKRSASLTLLGFTWIDKEQNVAGMGCPRNKTDMQNLKERNIGTIISLTENPLPSELQDSSMTYVHVPIENYTAPSLEQINKVMDAIDASLKDNKKVLIHCQAGKGRTGTMLACWLIKSQNFDPDQAIASVRTIRLGSIETPEQQQAITAYWKSLQETDESSEEEEEEACMQSCSISDDQNTH